MTAERIESAGAPRADAPRPSGAGPTPDEVGRHMFATDRASRGLGMRIVALGAGTARLEMAVRDDMLNGHEICHGGFITTLADSAFAFACNATNQVTVAAGLTVDFLLPARRGDVLTAEATEVSRTGKSGVYDMVVTNQAGAKVALVRGRSIGLGRLVIGAAAGAAGATP